MKYNKLVRDKIPAIIKKNGGKPKIRLANNKEYSKKLKEKLEEEVKEFLKSDNIEELADILEVIDALADYLKVKKKKLHLIQKNKAQSRGRFKKRIILIES